MNQHDQTTQQTRMFLENMVGFAMQAKEAGLDVTLEQVVDSTLGKILELSEQHFPLAKVLDDSDLVLHAEGPGASNQQPGLSALNWVTTTFAAWRLRISTCMVRMAGCWPDGSTPV